MLQKDVNPYVLIDAAYSIFAESNDPVLKSLYEAHLNRKKERQAKLEKERQAKIYQTYLESRVASSVLKDFFTSRF